MERNRINNLFLGRSVNYYSLVWRWQFFRSNNKINYKSRDIPSYPNQMGIFL